MVASMNNANRLVLPSTKGVNRWMYVAIARSSALRARGVSKGHSKSDWPYSLSIGNLEPLPLREVFM